MELRIYDPYLDSIISILDDTCIALDTCSKLHISGLGLETWPVHVDVDLSVLLEQLPTLILHLAAHEPAELYLYEQGVEILLRFTPEEGNQYIITTASPTPWLPAPAPEKMSAGILVTMLQNVVETYLHALSSIRPELADHPWVQQWLAGQN